MATKSKTTAVVKQEAQELAFAQETPDYIKQSTRGSEEVSQNDLVLPRLEIVQAQSPIKDEEGVTAVDGDMFNSVTHEVLGNQIYFVPVYFRLEWLVWKDADEGGGFFGAFPTKEDAEARRLEVIEDGEDPDDIEIVDTPVQYGLRLSSNGNAGWKPEIIVISMAKSKAKVSRKWNAMIQIAGGDRFSRVYKITTVKDENKQGKKFMNYAVQPAGFTPEAIYKEAEKLYDMFKVGGVRVAHESAGGAEGSGDTERGEI